MLRPRRLRERSKKKKAWSRLRHVPRAPSTGGAKRGLCADSHRRRRGDILAPGLRQIRRWRPLTFPVLGGTSGDFWGRRARLQWRDRAGFKPASLRFGSPSVTKANADCKASFWSCLTDPSGRLLGCGMTQIPQPPERWEALLCNLG